MRPGLFVELHTIDFDTLEAAIGPQLQLWLFDTTSVQLRGGAGITGDGRSNVELSTVLLALPLLQSLLR